jgi:2-dehydro-3-deoxygalactonokinase
VKSRMWISVDLGNSAFRMLVLDGDPPQVLHAWASADGAAAMYRSWAANEGGLSKADAMRGALARLIRQGFETKPFNGCDVPVVVSGMASSSIGIEVLPYVSCPFPLDGHGLVTRTYPADDIAPFTLHCISGLRGPASSMRGEETLLVGLYRLSPERFAEPVRVVMPGTHSMHVDVERGVATDVSAHMTGELFAVLRRDSLLAQSVVPDALQADEAMGDAFRDGVTKALHDGLSVSLFGVRARDLLHHTDRRSNTCFLSGLLVGAEVASISPDTTPRLLLTATEPLATFYRVALEIAGFHRVAHATGQELVDAFVAGQRSVL